MDVEIFSAKLAKELEIQKLGENMISVELPWIVNKGYPDYLYFFECKRLDLNASAAWLGSTSLLLQITLNL